MNAFDSMSKLIPIFLNCIHETLLDLVEDDDAEAEEDNHEDCAVGEPAPADELASTEERELDGLDDRRHGVERHDGIKVEARNSLADHGRERIDDRGRVHPELHDEGEKDLEVAVLGGHRADQDAEAEGQAGDEDDEHRGQQRVDVRTCDCADDGVDHIDCHEQAELDAEAQEVADDVRDRHDQPREIDLAEDVGVGHEGVSRRVQTVREVLPHTDTAEVEERLWHAVSRDACDSAEDDHVHDDSQQRLDQIPQRSQDGLLILYDNVSLYEQQAQVAVVPEFLEVHRKKFLFRLDDCIPISFHLNIMDCSDF